ncbi:hypothetical protein C2R22_07480 [Salinigranum rubrum]|uniref:Uncharacterized protein n=1 Tax=Salinigranum rubrum TaxID=755307 RepID=A0A2I8VI03_9EURY|nr:hypothetical protein C2R22_07480 [Salinigranum rubrum]
MDDSRTDPSSARLVDHFDGGDHEAAAACLERTETEAASSRKRTLQALGASRTTVRPRSPVSSRHSRRVSPTGSGRSA